MSRLLGALLGAVFLLVACFLANSAPYFKSPTCTPTVALPIKLADYDLPKIVQSGPGLFIYCYPYQYYSWNTVYAADADAACQHLFKPTKCECGITYVTDNTKAFLNVNGTIIQINANVSDDSRTPITDAFKLVSMGTLEQQNAEATGPVKMFSFEEDTFNDDAAVIETLAKSYKQVPTPCDPEHGKVKPKYHCQMPSHGHEEF